MSEKRRDRKNRILRTGESQRKDGRYAYKYVDTAGKTRFAYAWKLVPTDKTPVGKKDDISLREKEKIIRTDLDARITSTDMSVSDLYEKHSRYKANVRENTQAGRKQLARILSEDSLGSTRIKDVKLSDAKDWALRMKANGYAYQTIANHKRSLKAAFYTAIQDDVLVKNPFDFPISDVLDDDTPPKTPLTQAQETSLLDFIMRDRVYSKYLDEVRILLETGLRISEMCGLTFNDIDMDARLIHVNHQLLRHSDHSYYIEEPKTDSSIRTIPMSHDVYQALVRIVQHSKGKHSFSCDGYSGFLFLNRNGKPRTAVNYESIFRGLRSKYNKQHPQSPLLCPFTPHTLRHTFCTKLAHSGMNPKALQYIMGHKNITMTLNYYAHTTADIAIAEMKKYIG